MKVLAIRGRNLASLGGEFEIDFTTDPLLTAGIFAISGPTGAGKSTLLDCMCLALFARTPRTDQAKENNIRVKDINEDTLVQSDPRFVLRRGTASGYAETDFLALNGYRYRARWSISRAREKENGKLQHPRITLHNLDTGTEEQGSRSELQSIIIKLIGLTFEQFTRSVLLAQNDFSTFLKADQGEKAALLEKLTGTEQYSLISRIIYEKNSKAKEAYETIREKIQGIEILSEGEEKELLKQQDVTEQKLKHFEKLRTERQIIRDAIKAAEQTLTVKHMQQQEANNKLKKATELFNCSRIDYEKTITEQQQVEQIYNAIQPELQEARKLDLRLEIEKKVLVENKTTCDKAKKELVEKEEQLKQLTVRKEKGLEEIGNLLKWQEKYRSKEEIADQLSVLLLHLDNAAVSRDLMVKANERLESLNLRNKETNKKIDLLDLTDRYSSVEEITQAVKECRTNREKLLVEQTRFIATGDIQSLRRKLVDNMPCPVCGSTEHPFASPSANDYILQLAKDISALTKRLSELEKLTRFIQDKEHITSQIPREKEELHKHTTSYNSSLFSIDQLFGNQSWRDNWIQNPAGFRTTLTDFADKWFKNKERLHELQLQQSGWKSECELHESYVKTLRKQTKEKEISYERKLTEWENLQQERSRLLKGESADTVEKGLNDQLDKLKKQLNTLHLTQTEQANIAEQCRGIAGQIASDMAKTNDDLVAYNKALEDWTKAYYESSGNDMPLDAIWDLTNRQKTELDFQLRNHVENKKKIAGLQDELNTCKLKSEQWAKLNELAGSADGAKFRRIAQGYTLDMLLRYANVQLKNLTNRYRLERVPDTLALQVIDRDMCDEIRTVHSLSGGESFLVSLALALGLSSVSSNRMKVETLFIDEGFGSLDADTLRIALDALESLRTQGRKIGVISHVPEMTERIPVQIKVCRAGNGRSFVKIS